MPDLYKPHKLSCIQNIQAIGGQQYLFATIFYGFDLTDPDALLSEAVYTETATASLPMGGFLDMGFPKAVPEVLIAGEARAPQGASVQAQEVGFAVGSVKKRAMVFGDRHWVNANGDVRMSHAVPYEAMPLEPSRAFGNETHPVNPAGMGCNPHYALDHFGYAQLPNIENPAALIKTLTDQPDPVLFGPLSHDHPLRKSKLGQPSWDWIRTSFPEPPPGFDEAYFNMAPADQRLVSPLQGNEQLSVWGMSAQRPQIQSRLPGLRVRLFAVHDRKAARITEIGTRLETLWLFGTAEIGGLYHRGVLPVADEKASDIVALIFGAERLGDELRPASYYAEVYRLRTHPTEGAMHTLNDSQLMPDLREADKAAIDARSQAYSEEIARKFEKKMQFEYADMLKKANMPAMLTPDASLPPVPRLPLPAPEDIVAGNVDLAGMFSKLGAAADQMEADLMKGPNALIAKHKAAGLPLPDTLLDPGKMLKEAKKAGDANVAKGLKSLASDMPVSGDVSKFARAAVNLSTANPPVATPPVEEVMPGGVDAALAKIDAVLGRIDAAAAAGEGEEQLWQLVRARALALPEADPFYELKKNLEDMSKDMKQVAAAPKSGEMITVDELLSDSELQELKPTDFDKVLAELATMPAENKANLDKLEAILAEKLPKTAGHDLPPSLALARDIENTPVPKPDVTSVDDIIAKAEAAISMDAAAFFGDLDEEARDFLLNQDHVRSSMLEAAYPAETYTPEIRRKLGRLIVEHLDKGESFARRDIADADLTGVDLSRQDLNGVFLEKADLTGASLQHSDMTGAALTEAVLNEADATGTDFSRTSLSGVTAVRARFDRARFEGRSWSEAGFHGASFREAVFEQIVFLECDLAEADFEKATFVDCLFLNCDFTGASMREARFTKTMIVECDLSRSDWSGVHFDRQLMTKVKARESRWSNAHFTKSTFVGQSDLKGSYFNGLKGHHSSFLEANLDETCFLRADLRDCLFLNCAMAGVDFRAARVRKAVFNDSVLVHSDFFAADLMEAHLSSCDARYTSFRGANLYSANLIDAAVQCADFSRANLAQTVLELPSGYDA